MGLEGRDIERNKFKGGGHQIVQAYTTASMPVMLHGGIR